MLPSMMPAVVLFQTLLFFTSLISFANAGLGFDYFHAPQDVPQFQPGWMEPGLWRPKWIMERTFVDPESGKVLKKDKMIFKLKMDRTMKIYRQEKRPFLEIWKKKSPEDEKKKKLFETGEEEAVNTVDDQIKKKLKPKEYEGTWWFKDESPLKTGHVKLETKETAFGEEQKILHDVRCEWGSIDKYAARFRRGKIFRYKTDKNGVITGNQDCGSFIIKATPHRPLVGKDFLAFE